MPRVRLERDRVDFECMFLFDKVFKVVIKIKIIVITRTEVRNAKGKERGVVWKNCHGNQRDMIYRIISTAKGLKS